MSKLVTVYSPAGKAEQHTIPNARDLINAGWSYSKAETSKPIDPLPAAVVPSMEEKKALEAKKIGQEIFDRYGSSGTEEIIRPQPEARDVPAPAEEAPEVVEEVAPVVTEEEPKADATPRGRRFRKE